MKATYNNVYNIFKFFDGRANFCVTTREVKSDY